jgi:uncharacterized membrane-anchored protein
MKIFMAHEVADGGVKMQAKCARISITYDTLKSKERDSQKSSKFSRDLIPHGSDKSVAKQDIIYFKIEDEDIELSRALARAQQEKEPQEHVVFLLVARIRISLKIEDIQLSRAPARVQQDEEPQEHVVFLLVARIRIVSAK